jgi:hypothetical protein
MARRDSDPRLHDVVPPLDESTRASLTAWMFRQREPQAPTGELVDVPVRIPVQLDDDATNAVVRDLALWGRIPAMELARAAVRVFDLEYQGKDACVEEHLEVDTESGDELVAFFVASEEDLVASESGDLSADIAMNFCTVGERSMLRAILRRLVAEADRGQ